MILPVSMIDIPDENRGADLAAIDPQASGKQGA
jgi:hypothetical protein